MARAHDANQVSLGPFRSSTTKRTFCGCLPRSEYRGRRREARAAALGDGVFAGADDGGGDAEGAGGCWTEPFWYFLGVTRSALAREASVARTIRFPSALRDKITVDAERCGRSFEAQVIALLRRHYGEDVDIAPNPADILALATASLAGVQGADLRSVVRKLRSPER